MDILKRPGRFSIPAPLLANDPWTAMAILRDCIVVRAENTYWHNRIEYVAFHPEFELANPGDEAPDYTAQIIRHDEGFISVRWRRTPPLFAAPANDVAGPVKAAAGDA